MDTTPSSDLSDRELRKTIRREEKALQALEKLDYQEAVRRGGVEKIKEEADVSLATLGGRPGRAIAARRGEERHLGSPTRTPTPRGLQRDAPTSRQRCPLAWLLSAPPNGLAPILPEPREPLRPLRAITTVECGLHVIAPAVAGFPHHVG
jgi:hypothetical protein